MSVLGGALSYRKSTNNFFVNETGTNDGWVPLRYSLKGSDLTDEDVNELIDRIGGSNSAQLFVDVNNPRSSDARDNKGNTKLRPFKSIERALLEASRRSFRLDSPDIYERTSIMIAPGEYHIYNGPGQLIGEFQDYNRYQDASTLILRNREWILEQSFAAIPPIHRSDVVKSDLRYLINSLVNDLSTGGNYYVLRLATSLISSDLEIDCQNVGYFVPEYFDSNKRQSILNALDSIKNLATQAMRNEGVWVDSSITADEDSPSCANVESTIHTLVDIIVNTFSCTIDPRVIVPNPGAVNNQNIPDGEITGTYFQSFNSSSKPGVILPRGVSLIGEDLRKVVIKPRYVPSPGDNSVGRGALFRMTGGNFIANLTIKDSDGVNHSHHKLSAFEFVTENDLEVYYNAVNLSFSDKSIYHRAQDAANLLMGNITWLSKKSAPELVPSGYINYAKIFEAEIFHFIISIVKDLKNLSNKEVISFGKRFYNAHIVPVPSENREAVAEYYTNLFNNAVPYLIQAIRNEANTAEGGFIDRFVTPDTTSQEGRCANIASAIYVYKDLVTKRINSDSDPDPEFASDIPLGDSGAYPAETEIVAPVTILDANRVSAASPYIFSISIRSKYGLCGVDADGSQVTGFKSFLAAQFTVISIQTDQNAFTLDSTEVGGKRFKGAIASDRNNPSVGDWRNFGYRIRNSAYAQLVSCFCIGPALHYINKSGGEMSITNSTSNFGDISLYAIGFNDDGLGGGAYPQDRGYKLVSIKKAERLFSTVRNFSIGSIESVDYSNNSITFSNVINTRGFSLLKDDPLKNSKVFVSFRPQDAFDTIELSAKSFAIEEIDGKTILYVNFDNKPEWENNTVDGLVVYIKRYVDNRRINNKYYKFILERDLLSGARAPVDNYIIRKHNAGSEQPFKTEWNEAHGKGQLYYLEKAERIISPDADNIGITPRQDKEYYEIITLSAYVDEEGNMEYISNLEESSELDLDYDPEFVDLVSAPSDNISYHNTKNIIRLLGVDSNQVIDNQWNLDGSRFIDLDGHNLYIDLNKPSTIRCGGQTWEYVGYFNYSTGLPQLQTGIIGEGLTPVAANAKKISKIQSPKFGGRIYATGMDEFGQFFLGNQILDLKTGQSERIDLGDVISSRIELDQTIISEFDNLNVDNLTIDDILNFNGNEINLNGIDTRINAPNGLILNVGGEDLLEIDNNGNVLSQKLFDNSSVTILSEFTPIERPDGGTLRAGDIWFDTVKAGLYIYYIGPQTSYWIQVNEVASTERFGSFPGVTPSIPSTTEPVQSPAWDNGPTTLTSTGCLQISLSNSNYGQGPLQIEDGDILWVRWTPSAACGEAPHGTSINGTITDGDYSVGGIMLIDRLPNSFSIPTSLDQPLGSVSTSAQVPLSGFNAPTKIWAGNTAASPEVSINGGSWVALPGSFAAALNFSPLESGSNIRIRHTNSSSANTQTSTVVRIGYSSSQYVEASFNSTTVGLAGAVAQPSILTPVNGAVNIASPFAVTSTNYSSTTGQPHDNSDWQIYENSYPIISGSNVSSVSSTGYGLAWEDITMELIGPGQTIYPNYIASTSNYLAISNNLDRAGTSSPFNFSTQDGYNWNTASDPVWNISSYAGSFSGYHNSFSQHLTDYFWYLYSDNNQFYRVSRGSPSSSTTPFNYYIYTSTNGLNWSSGEIVTNPFSALTSYNIFPWSYTNYPSGTKLKSVFYNNGDRFVAQVDVFSRLGYSGLNSIIYNYDYSFSLTRNGVTVATQPTLTVTSDKFAFSNTFDITGTIASIFDSSSWFNNGYNIMPTTLITASNGNNIVAIDPRRRTIRYSINNGSTWMRASTAAVGSGSSLVAGNNNFVVGGTGGVFHSPNGSNWSKVATNIFSNNELVNNVAFGDGIFLAVSESGKVAISTNGSSWSLVKSADEFTVDNRTNNSSTAMNLAYFKGAFYLIAGAPVGDFTIQKRLFRTTKQQLLSMANASGDGWFIGQEVRSSSNSSLTGRISEINNDSLVLTGTSGNWSSAIGSTIESPSNSYAVKANVENSTAAKTSYNVLAGTLDNNKTHFVRVRHGDGNVKSQWSPWSKFTTA